MRQRVRPRGGAHLGELHLVHALAGVPVEEGLAAEHRGELLSDALHHLLHARRVAAEADRHLEALWRDVADRALEVVRDPLDEVRREFLFWTLSICSSTSLVDMRPRKRAEAVR